jgi:hypothetical protein
MDSREKTTEDRRYLFYRLGAHFAWWSAFGLAAALTISRVSREVMAPPTRFEQVSGIFIILLMGVAIALGSALARMRLARTITRVFEAGMMVGHLQGQQKREDRT